MNFENSAPSDPTKREFVKKAAYVVPAVITLAAAPSFASAGSNSKDGKKARKRGPKGKKGWSKGIGRGRGKHRDD